VLFYISNREPKKKQQKVSLDFLDPNSSNFFH